LWGMLKAGVSATDLGYLELLCREEHCVARLKKQVAHQPIRIALPGQAPEEWPREGDEERTWVHCPLCDEWCGGDTSVLQQIMDELLSDESENEDSYILPHR
jgi:hypothetical protein